MNEVTKFVYQAKVAILLCNIVRRHNSLNMEEIKGKVKETDT